MFMQSVGGKNKEYYTRENILLKTPAIVEELYQSIMVFLILATTVFHGFIYWSSLLY